MAVFHGILLALGAAFLIWRSASLGIAEYYLMQEASGYPNAADSALVWRPHHPDALYLQARAKRDEDTAAASALQRQAYSANPTDARPLLALAALAQAADDQDRADALLEAAATVMPADPWVQASAGGYWAGRGDLAAAMTHWSQALEASQAHSWERLFPVLLALAEDVRTIGVFKPIAASPPSWWDRFFAETARRAGKLETVRFLYAFRRAADASPVTGEEREHYVRRLQREGEITEAYLVWVNGLDAAGRRNLGVINNGGFELEPSNQGFGWHVRRAERVDAATRKTSGVKGEKALHLVFKRREARYSHVHQPLFLDPSTYRARGMVRTDSLDSQGGLKWVVRCLLPEENLLGESERFLGSSEWREFSFSFRVPSDCASEEIRLVSAGSRSFEYKITGGIWFDDLSMRKVSTQPAEAPSPILRSGAPATEAAGRRAASQVDDPLEATGRGVFSFDEALFDRLPAPLD